MSANVPVESEPSLNSLPGAQFRFCGPMGDRLEANIRGWLVPAVPLSAAGIEDRGQAP